jgi:hypothetical protein
MRTWISLILSLVLLACGDMIDKEFISNNNWFQLTYPRHWTEFDEENGAYLFMDNENWKGSLRITAMRLSKGDEESKKEYLKTTLKEELEENIGAIKVKLGDKDAVYYTKDTNQDGDMLEIHYWLTGDKTTLLICTFSIDKDKANKKEIIKELELAKNTLTSIQVMD